MRRAVSGLFLLVVGLVAGFFLGRGGSIGWPGGLPGIEQPADIISDADATATAAMLTVSEFQLVLRDDQIFYRGQPIGEAELDTVIDAAKAQNEIIRVEYDAATVTGRFVDDVQARLRNAEVQHIVVHEE